MCYYLPSPLDMTVLLQTNKLRALTDSALCWASHIYSINVITKLIIELYNMHFIIYCILCAWHPPLFLKRHESLSVKMYYYWHVIMVDEKEVGKWTLGQTTLLSLTYLPSSSRKLLILESTLTVKSHSGHKSSNGKILYFIFVVE